MGIKIVIGANFGDEGKGQLTDYFASKSNNAIVVLHNGGAQRAHTVVTPEGYRHVFRHMGSGTFTDAHTYIAEEFIVNPILFRQEYEKLSKHNLKPKVFINPKCKLTTIYDMLINQAIEADRGNLKHGSCGVGIFETIYRNRSGVEFKEGISINPLAMTVGDFAVKRTLDQLNFLDVVRKDYLNKRFNSFGLKKISTEFLKVLSSAQTLINFIEDFKFMIKHSEFAQDDILFDYDTVIFENGQGLLLDQHNEEYYPHLTPSNTGIKNPLAILANLGIRDNTVEACYVTRTYMTRHGAGRFDTECDKRLINSAMIDMTNVPNPFQDSLRYGSLDLIKLESRIADDVAEDSTTNCMIIPTIAFTHINEFNKFMNPYNKKWVDLTNEWHVKVSNGMTRETIAEVHKGGN